MLIESEYKARLSEMYRALPKSHLRELAWNKAWEIGLPDRKEEAFRKVSIRPLFLHKGFSVSASLSASKRENQIVFLNGIFDSASSHVPSNILIESIEKESSSFSGMIQNRLQKNLGKEKQFFPLMIEAMQERGVFIYVPPKTRVGEPISISALYAGNEGHFTTKMQLYVGRESEVTFILEPEFFEFGSAFIGDLIDIHLEAGAHVNWIEPMLIPESALYLHHLRSTLKRDSRLDVWSFGSGSDLYRGDYSAELEEEGSHVSLKGSAFMHGKRKLHTNVLVKHLAPHATSNQHYKVVLSDQALSTFEGKIFVASIAQKTEAYQLNNHLFLSDKATCFSKPNLEIFADDVKATHGSTITSLSEEELFYLRARGIDPKRAKEMLSFGFLDSIIKEIPSERVMQMVRTYYGF